MTPQPQRVFIITEENLDKLVKNGVSKKSEEIAYLVKQCPTPSPCEDNGCTDIENCDEICQHSRLYSPIQMEAAKKQAAAQAREKALKPISAIYERFKHLDAILSKRDPDCPMMICYVDIWEAVKKSLRSTGAEPR
jgi:hypothetical protein